MNNYIVLAVFVGVFIYLQSVSAQMTSTNYQILWDSVNSGGLDISSSTNYQLRDTIGQGTQGRSLSTTYIQDAGYRSGIYDQVLSLNILGQNDASSRAASSLSSLTITIDPTGLSVGDYIVLIQDRGVSQVSGIGKIVSLSGSTVTLDRLSTNGTTPVIDGTNDYVYELTGTSISLGTITTSAVQTSLIGFDTTADLSGGYTLQIKEDGELRSGSYTIDDVSDGTVSAASEEYGARSSDTSLSTTFDTQDTAITSAFQEIVSSSIQKFDDRHFLTLKASAGSSSYSGSYSQTLSVILSGNF
ncbi:TPA: hypothetical protein DEP34_03830 [Candidatus Uhrbacteria bacterium]|nr:hypothetical protein [Candidatus Uhrbacteria bacterium]HCB19486.1 hypothetical protein [Candidatus Uhrbacteria bacterium]